MKKNLRFPLIFIFLLLSNFLITACSSKEGGAVKAIENYIIALSNKDSVQISNYSCSTWEQDALLEVDSLTAVGSTVEKLSCTEIGTEGNLEYISCSGYLALDYNGEAQQIDLSTRTYIAKQEGGEWRMCGYR